MNNPHPPPFRHGDLPEWKPCKVFVDPESMVAIQVSSRTLPVNHEGQVPKVHYSFEIGRMQTNRLYRHFQAQCLVEHGKAHIIRFPSDVLGRLMKEMEDWVEDQHQERENLVMENRIARERAQSEKGKESPRGLRTLSKRDAAFKKEE